jgi:large subunit ribosomal protein L24
MARIRLKKGDAVVVISGDFKGQRGKILTIDRAAARLQVEGVSKGKKKTLKKSLKNQHGGLVDRMETIHVSNVMLAANYDTRRQRRARPGA